jgi:hypothetical protein
VKKTRKATKKPGTTTHKMPVVLFSFDGIDLSNDVELEAAAKRMASL